MHVNSSEERYNRPCFLKTAKNFCLFRNVAGASVSRNTLWKTVAYMVFNIFKCQTVSQALSCNFHLSHMSIYSIIILHEGRYLKFKTKGLKGQQPLTTEALEWDLEDWNSRPYGTSLAERNRAMAECFHICRGKHLAGDCPIELFVKLGRSLHFPIM